MKHTLAIVAALLLLLRPVCDVLAAVPAHDEQAGHVHALAGQVAESEDQSGEPPCCASLGDGALVQSGEVAAVRAGSEGKPAFPAAPWMFARNADRYNERADSWHPPGVVSFPISFYARTARIRR